MNDIKFPIVQLKLTSGEEVICEVVSEDPNNVVVRKVMQIDAVQFEDYTNVHVMRPWMLYQDSLDQALVIKPTNILAQANPSKALLLQYYSTLSQTLPAYHARETHSVTSDDDLQEFIDAIYDMDEAMQIVETDLGDDVEVKSSTTDSSSTGNIVYLDTTLH